MSSKTDDEETKEEALPTLPKCPKCGRTPLSPCPYPSKCPQQELNK